jgi:hypothetical protein
VQVFKEAFNFEEDVNGVSTRTVYADYFGLFDKWVDSTEAAPKVQVIRSIY